MTLVDNGGEIGGGLENEGVVEGLNIIIEEKIVWVIGHPRSEEEKWVDVRAMINVIEV